MILLLADCYEGSTARSLPWFCPALLAAPQATRPEPPERRGSDDRVGMIELDLPTGARLRVDAFVNETALARVLRAMKRAT